MKKLALHWIIIIIVLAITFIFLLVNASKEFLNQFFEVNLGIENTTKTLETENTYEGLENFQNKEKSDSYIELINKLQPASEELTDFIQNMKYDLVYKVDGEKVYLFPKGEEYEEGNDEANKIFLVEGKSYDEIDKTKQIRYLKAKGNREASGNVFNPKNEKSKAVDENGDGRASQLRKRMLEYEQFLIDILSQAEKDNLILGTGSIIADIKSTFDKIQEDRKFGKKGSKVNWEVYNFYDMPAVAAFTLLTKWQSDIKNMEAEVISFLVKGIPPPPIRLEEYDSIYYYKDGTVEKKIIRE